MDVDSAAHLAMALQLFAQQPMLLLILVAAFQRGVHSKLAMWFDGTPLGSILRWESVPVVTVPSMPDLLAVAGDLIPMTNATALHRVFVEVSTNDEQVSLYSVPLAHFCGVNNTEAELTNKIATIAAMIQADQTITAHIEQIIAHGHS